MALLTAAIDHGPTPVKIRTAGGATAVRTLDFSKLPAGNDLDVAAGHIGILPRHQMQIPLVDSVAPGGAADGVLKPGDRILAVGDTPVALWADLPPLVARLGEAGGGTITFERNGARKTATLVPRWGSRPKEAGGGQTWQLGIGAARDVAKAPKDALLRYGPIEAVPAAFHETKFQIGELFGMFKRAFDGRLAVKNTFSGPIGIARAANAYAKNGLAWYLSLLALLSLSLGVLNLLPVPVLDGGHLLYYLIELLKGGPLSDRAMAAGQYVGLALLLGLMGLAFYNDLQGLIR